METGSSSSGRKRKHESTSSDEPDTVQGDTDPRHSTEPTEKSADTDSPPTQAQAPLKTADKWSVQQKKASAESDIPTYYETVPTLQNMSSIAAMIELWRQVIRTPDCEEEFRFLGFGHNVKLCQHFVSELAVPGLIRECVGNHLLRVLHEMEKWFQGYRKLLDGAFVTNILFCSWLSDGKIDYRASALNMLSNPRLTQNDKFKIMFSYCLEDEIKKSSVESLPTDFAENVDFESKPLMYYWLCYMKGELDKVPKENETESIASRMIKVCDTWSAIEYFWHQLNDDERTSVLETILERNPEFQKKLFSKMSEAQKIRIISDIPVKIMKNFWFQPGQEQFAFQTWIYIRNFVLDGQFEEIMKFITLHKRTAWDIEDKCRYLAAIWNHCPDHLKKLAYEDPIMIMILGNKAVFGTDVFQGYECSYNGIEFITDYLSHFDSEFRKKLIFERPWVIVSFLDQSVTDYLINLYLPDSNDVKAFKKIVLESYSIRALVRKIMKQIDDFEAINKFMDVFCPDSRIRAEFAYDIVRWFTHWNQIYSARGTPKHVKLTDFARQNFSNSLSSRERNSLSCKFQSMYMKYWQEFSGPHH